MSAGASAAEVLNPARVAPKAARIASIDIFRGLTILVMIFVNDLAGVKGLPWWTYHLPGNVNGMTYVDMVFPFFLFIVGLSIPLAVNYRIAKGDSMARLLGHVVARSFALCLLGIALANFENVNAALTHVSGNVWLTLMLAGAILFWNVYPRAERYRGLFLGAKLAGLLLMAAMFALFRRTARDGHVAWLDFGYWEILGIIGFTYLGTCVAYLPTRRWRWAPLFWCVVFGGLNAAALAHKADFVDHLPMHYWPWSNGCFCLLMMAGIAVSSMVLSDAFARTVKVKTAWALGFAAVLLVSGYVLTPLGISKIRATPTWGLYSAGAATLCFVALYWICDVGGRVAWASPVRAAGSNTLLTYLLPDLFFVTLGGMAFLAQFGFGWPGVVKSLVFTAVMLGLSTLLTRAGLRMQL